MIEVRCKHCHKETEISLADILYIDNRIYHIYGISARRDNPHDWDKKQEHTLEFNMKKDEYIRRSTGPKEDEQSW